MADASIASHKGAHKVLTADELRKILRYDPGTGTFMWMVTLSKRNKAGNMAGFVNQGGTTRRVKIGIRGSEYPAHRLAWLYMNGKWPESEIDHIDGDGTNNRWSNLRAATSSENLRNRGPQRNNTSGYKGVTYVTKRGVWVAGIKLHGCRINLGAFHSAESAHKAYCLAAEKYHGEFKRVM